jgi:hypothetical protein
VLVYQHYGRERRDSFALRLVGDMRQRTGSSFVEGFTTPHVLFLLAAQPHHAGWLRESIIDELPRWQGQIAALGPSREQQALNPTRRRQR